jgi:membrane protease YdiL (CAAX protease family)
MPTTETISPALLAFFWVLFFGIVLAWAWAIARLRSGQPLLPPSKPDTKPVPWGSAGLGAVLLVWLSLNVVVGVSIGRLGGGPKDRPIDQMLMVSGVNLGMILLVPRALALTSGARLADLGLGRGPFLLDLTRGVVGCLLVLPGVYAVNALALRIWPVQKHPLEEMIRADHSAPTIVLALLSAVILAPAAEEMIFRGVLQPWFAAFLARTVRRLGSRNTTVLTPEEPLPLTDEIDLIGGLEAAPACGPLNPYEAPKAKIDIAFDQPAAKIYPAWTRPLSVVLTAALFGGIHVPQWPAPLAIFVLALALGVLYARTGRLVAAIAMHACFNGISTVAVFLAVSGGKVPEAPPGPAANSSGIWAWQNQSDSGILFHSHHPSPARDGWSPGQGHDHLRPPALPRRSGGLD